MLIYNNRTCTVCTYVVKMMKEVFDLEVQCEQGNEFAMEHVVFALNSNKSLVSGNKKEKNV